MVGRPLSSNIKRELQTLSGQIHNDDQAVVPQNTQKTHTKKIEEKRKPKPISIPQPVYPINDDDIREVPIKNKKGVILHTYKIRRWRPRQMLVYNSKVALIGKPGSGKSTAIADICWQFKDLIPVGQVFSGTETENGFYQNFFPAPFIIEYYDEKRLLKFLIRQRDQSRQLMEAKVKKVDENQQPNPKALLILDDLADQGCFDRRLFKTIFKMGRHWHMLVILALQNALDMKPHLRQTVDYLVLFKEMQKKPLEKLYSEYAGCVPTVDEFRQIMQTINKEKYTALVIDNKGQGTSIEECIFWWKADCHPPFKFGSSEYQLYGKLIENQVKYDPLKAVIKEMKKEMEKKKGKKK